MRVGFGSFLLTSIHCKAAPIRRIAGFMPDNIPEGALFEVDFREVVRK